MQSVYLLLWPCLPLLNISGYLELSFWFYSPTATPQTRLISERQWGGDGVGSSVVPFMCVCLSDGSLPSCWPFLTPHVCTVQAIKTLISDQGPGHTSLALSACVAGPAPCLPCLLRFVELWGRRRWQRGRWVVGAGAAKGKREGVWVALSRTPVCSVAAGGAARSLGPLSPRTVFLCVEPGSPNVPKCHHEICVFTVLMVTPAGTLEHLVAAAQIQDTPLRPSYSHPQTESLVVG